MLVATLSRIKSKSSRMDTMEMMIVIMTMIVVMIVDLEKDKVKLEDRYDGDAKGEPVDATKVRQEHFPCVPEI